MYNIFFFTSGGREGCKRIYGVWALGNEDRYIKNNLTGVIKCILTSSGRWMLEIYAVWMG